MPFFGLTDITIKQESTRGPLRPLFEKITKKTFRYPVDIGNYDKAHYMVIHIFKQRSSKFGGISGKGDLPTSMTNTGGAGGASIPNVKEKFSSAINGGIDKAFNSINKGLGGKLNFFKASGSSFSSAKEAQKTRDTNNYIESVRKIQREAAIDTTIRTEDSIALYMPDTVQFTYSQNYESMELGKELAGQAFETGSSAFEKLKSGESMNLGGTMKAALQATLAKGAGALFGAENTAKTGLFLATGAVVNPRMEILYTSPNFREFSFEFMFYPRDEREALEVQNIIERLRFHQAPELDDSSNGFLLIAPSEFEVEFYYAGKINPNVPQMTRCILSNISVNYAPNGWSTYEMPSEFSPALGRTGMPTAIQMTLDFKETQFLTKRDFRNSSDENTFNSTSSYAPAKTNTGGYAQSQ